MDYISDKILTRFSQKTISNIGGLYDCLEECFLPLNLFQQSFAESGLITSCELGQNEFHEIYESGFFSKLDHFQLDASIKVNLLLFDINGNAGIFSQKFIEEKFLNISMVIKIKTVQETINILDPEILHRLNMDSMHQIEKLSTHFVSEIKYGACIHATFKFKEIKKHDKNELNGGIVSKMIDTAIKVSQGGNFDHSDNQSEYFRNVEIELISDLTPENLFLGSFEEFLKYFKKIPTLMKNLNNSKGVPIEYKLIPLKYILSTKIMKLNKSIKTIEESLYLMIQKNLTKILNLISEFTEFKEKFKTHANIFKGSITELDYFLRDLEKILLELKEIISKLISNYKLNIISQRDISKTISLFFQNNYNLEKLKNEKLKFIERDLRKYEIMSNIRKSYSKAFFLASKEEVANITLNLVDTHIIQINFSEIKFPFSDKLKSIHLELSSVDISNPNTQIFFIDSQEISSTPIYEKYKNNTKTKIIK